MTSDIKVWGTNPWEEGSWEIEEQFAMKWWFLMGEEVLRGTNTWRGSRGQRALTVSDIKNRFKKEGFHHSKRLEGASPSTGG
jgi:hypothetical protein